MTDPGFHPVKLGSVGLGFWGSHPADTILGLTEVTTL
jgi:hypothetical protein